MSSPGDASHPTSQPKPTSQSPQSPTSHSRATSHPTSNSTQPPQPTSQPTQSTSQRTSQSSAPFVPFRRLMTSQEEAVRAIPPIDVKDNEPAASMKNEDEDDEEEEEEEEETDDDDKHEREGSEIRGKALDLGGLTGAIPSHLRTSFSLANGTVLYVDGSVRSQSGQISDANDPTLEYALESLDCSAGLTGAVKFLDGSFLLRDGSILLPSHAVVLSSNSIMRWDGKTMAPRWKIALGARPLPTGSLFLPAGTIQYPDGTSRSAGTQSEAGKKVFPDGTFQDEAGLVVFPSGAKAVSTTTVQLPNGEQRPSLWFNNISNSVIPRFEFPELVQAGNDPVFDLRSLDLCSAAQACDRHMVERFLKGGVGDPNEKDSTGNTPLHLTWSLACAQLLIEFGGSSELPNLAGRQAGSKYVFAHKSALKMFMLKAQGNESEESKHEVTLTINIHCKDFPKLPKGHGIAVAVSGKGLGEADFLHVAETELAKYRPEITFQQDFVLEYRPGICLRFEAYSCPPELKRLQKELCKLIGIGEIDIEQVYASSKAGRYNIVQVRNPSDTVLHKALQAQSSSIRLRATCTEDEMDEATAVESTWLEMTIFCEDVPQVPGFVVAVFATDTEVEDQNAESNFKYVGSTEHIPADHLSQSPRFSHKIMFQHRVPEDNGRLVRFGLYSDPSIASAYLVGQAQVSGGHLLANNQVEANNNTLPLNKRQGTPSGARLGVLLRVVTESATPTKRYLPPDLEFTLKWMLPTAKDLKGKWLVEAWSRNNEGDKEYIGIARGVLQESARFMEFSQPLCLKNLDWAHSLHLVICRPLEETSDKGPENKASEKYECDFPLADVRLLQFSPKVVTFKIPMMHDKAEAGTMHLTAQMFGTLDVAVACTKLPRIHGAFSKCNPFVAVYWKGKKLTQTELMRNEQNPFFKRRLRLPLGNDLMGTDLEFIVCDVVESSSGLNMKSTVGSVKLPTIRAIIAHEHDPFFSYQLIKKKGAPEEETGTLDLRATFVTADDKESKTDTPPRMAGWLNKTRHGGLAKKWRKRYFVLQDCVLKYYMDESATEILGQFNVTKATVRTYEDLFGSSNAFTIVPVDQARMYYLQASVSPERDLWISCLARHGALASRLAEVHRAESKEKPDSKEKSDKEKSDKEKSDKEKGELKEKDPKEKDKEKDPKEKDPKEKDPKEKDPKEKDPKEKGDQKEKDPKEHKADKPEQKERSPKVAGGAQELPNSPRSNVSVDTQAQSISGYLGKTRRGGLLKNWKRRYFTLEQGTMTYYKDHTAGAVLGNFPVKGVFVQKHEELFGSMLAFSIHAKSRMYHLQAFAPKERDVWIQCLVANGAVLEDIKALAAASAASSPTARPSTPTV